MRLVEDALGVPRHLSGCRPSPPHLALGASKFALATAPMFPPRIDLRAVSRFTVRDQGSTGDCVTYGVGACQEVVAQRAGDLTWVPAHKWGYAKGREAEGTPLGEDSGLNILSYVKNVCAKTGAPDACAWPDSEPFDWIPPSNIDAQARHSTRLWFVCPDHDAIRGSIAQGFPVAVGSSVPASWMDEVGKTGLAAYPSGGDFVGTHCFALVGYDDGMTIGSDVGAYLAMNSWGEDWGQGGFFWVSYAYQLRGLFFDAITLRSEED